MYPSPPPSSHWAISHTDYVSSCEDYFDATYYMDKGCYKYEPSPGSVQSLMLSCNADGSSFTQQNFIDSGCGTPRNSFPVTTNTCGSGSCYSGMRRECILKLTAVSPVMKLRTTMLNHV
jgi:hypothetical protein